jgi:methenyltetrahydromethanopterin cyclohydrolase
MAARTLFVVAVAVALVVGAGEASAPAVEHAHEQLASASLLSCLLGCGTQAMVCTTRCSQKTIGEAPDCMLACGEANVRCVVDCGPALRPTPPPV